MATIDVDLAALGALRHQCVALRNAFQGDAPQHHIIDDIGPADITDTLHDFESHWMDGHAKVRHHLDGLVQRLDAAIAQYDHTEQRLRQRIEGSK